MSRSRGWCFTINSYSMDDVAFLMSLYEDDFDCCYLIVGFEVGRSGTKHLQGYVYYKSPKRFAHMKSLHSTWHIEPQKSKTNVASYCYCMEDGDYYEMGDRPRQGHRTDLEVIKYDIISGRPMIDIADKYFSQWCQYRRSFDEYKRMKAKYDTELICYDQDDLDYSMRIVYKDYGLDDSLLLTSQFDMPANDLMSTFYSGKYKRIFIPTGMSVFYPECIRKNISLVICQEE